MKKVIIIMMAVLLATLLVVSCKADVKAQEDRLSSVTVDSDVSRGFTTSIASNVDSIDQLVWYYKAVKTDGGLFVTGQQKNWTRLGGENGVGLVGKSLGYLSYGTWDFNFKAVKNGDGCSSADNAVYEAYLTNVSIHEENTSLVVSLSQGAAVTTAKVVFKDLSFVVGSGIEIDATNGVFQLVVKEDNTQIFVTAGSDAYDNGVTFTLTDLTTEKVYNAAGAHTYEFIVSYKPANGNWTEVTTTEYSVYIPLGIAATISGSVDAIESVSDTVVSGVAHSYVIYGDGSWHCITCTGNEAGHLLTGTDAAYITVLDKNRQPTTIIALTENATVGSGSITVSGNDVTYTNNGTNAVAQEVVIRTAGGTLTINAPLDTVKHYGSAQVVTLAAVSTSSYFENGSVNQVNIKKGRLVLTNNEEASVETVYLQATNDTYDNIILATQTGAELPNLIARDDVTLPEGDNVKQVVTIQTSVDKDGKAPVTTETINLYATQGDTGNDVYEANNGYNVTDLALLVVEASSTIAKEQAANQITDSEKAAQVTESKAVVEVDTEEEMTAALAAKAKYIIVTGSFDTTKAFLIKGSTVIEGSKLSDDTYPVITSKATASAEKRGFRISESNIDVTLRNLTVNVRDNVTVDNGYPRGVQVDSNITGISLLVDKCNISATHYAFNVCDGAQVAATFIDSKLLGYGALNLWHADYTVKVDNCVLEGVQNNKEMFAVVILEGDTTGKTYMHSSYVTVQIDNSEIKARCNNTAGGIEAFVGFNDKATSNTVKLNNCTLTPAGAGITRTVYDSGTGNKLYINDALFDVVGYYNAVFEETVQEKKDTIAVEMNNAVLYYWINPNGSKSGGFYSIEEPINSGYVMDGEFVVLLEDIVLTANSNGSSSLNSGDSFSFITDGHAVTGGTIKLGTNITAISDSGSLTCFVNTDGTAITATDNGNGTYSYTGS